MSHILHSWKQRTADLLVITILVNSTKFEKLEILQESKNKKKEKKEIVFNNCSMLNIVDTLFAHSPSEKNLDPHSLGKEK